MSLHLDARADGGFALFMDGDLQFDTADEALYHESMALPALCLAQPANACGLRVLICGGGDGLALRECLRFPGVARVDLVDYAPEVVGLGRTRFAEINQNAFADARVTVHLADAWEFLADAAPYDVILCDFTVPRRPEDTRVFSREWYARVRSALAPNGVAALNAVSPQMTPEAFWCIRRTVRAAGLATLPYRVCIPSFRAQGYGAWAFLLVAHRPLPQSCLRALACPVPTRQADLTQLWRGARFSRQERLLEKRVPIHSLDNECLLRLLLNPGEGIQVFRYSGIQDTPNVQEPEDLNTWTPEYLNTRIPEHLNTLLRAIPITHPYHTRQMVETLAAQVIGTVKSLDIRRLVDALLRRAAELPRDLLRELGRLRDFLRNHAPRLEALAMWSARLFAALIILMTLANAIAPDNAFAKGSFGLGHASMSRGYSGSFSGPRGFGSSSRSSSGSFGGARNIGSSSGAARASSFGGERSLGSSFGQSGSYGAPRAITSSGFRRAYGQGRPTDIYGYAYNPRVYVYCGGGGGHIHSYYVVNGGQRQNAPPPETHQALFVADDDMMVLDNGDVIITLSDKAYLLVTGGTVALMTNKLSDPLIALYPDPNLFQTITAQVQDQQFQARGEIAARRDWLAWVGWTSALFGSVSDDKLEMRNLEDLDRRLNAALTRVGQPKTAATPAPVPTGSVELFLGCFLQPDNRIALCGADGQWLYTDGKSLWTGKAGEAPRACPPELAEVLKSVLQKLQKEFTADIASDDNDLNQLASDRASLEKDLSEYQTLSYSYGTSYEVDYGTDEISASDAISRTQNDLDQNKQDTDQTTAERAKLTNDLARVTDALQRL